MEWFNMDMGGAARPVTRSGRWLAGFGSRLDEKRLLPGLP
jgi:hypothetical protein